MPPLPARVRVTRPPLPLAPALAQQVRRLCPAAPADLSAVALAIAGGSVIAAAVRWEGEKGDDHSQAAQGIDNAWKGRGIEEALQEALAG